MKNSFSKALIFPLCLRLPVTESVWSTGIAIDVFSSKANPIVPNPAVGCLREKASTSIARGVVTLANLSKAFLIPL